MSSGGTSGKVDFPAYMKHTHGDWMGWTTNAGTKVDTDLIEVMNTSLGVNGNPFENAGLTDPSTDLAEVDTRFGQLDTLMNNLDPQEDWKTVVDTVITKLDAQGVISDIDIPTLIEESREGSNLTLQEAIKAAGDVINDVVIRGTVRAFERRQDRTKIRAVNRFTGFMSDVNAVQSSAFLFGLALIESQHMQNVAEFDANLTTELYSRAVQGHLQTFQGIFSTRLQGELNKKRTRDALVGESINTLYTSLFNRIQLDRAVTELKGEIKRLKVVAVKEVEEADIDLDYRYAAWDFEVFQNGANVLASISGAAHPLPEKKSKFQSALGGALGGAAAGAPLGAPGMAAGALLGGLGGLFN